MFNGYGMQLHPGGWIVHPDDPKPRQVEPGAGVNRASVSPDGRWVAFGVNGGPISVFDPATGQRVWQSPGISPLSGRFTPDGRWLMTELDGGKLYAAGSWGPGPRLGPGKPWDAAAGMAVLGQSNGIYRLVERATGRELARLEDPELNNGQAEFTADGGRLVITAKNGLRLWDLRLLRTGLAEMGLDWDAPPFPKTLATGNMPALEVTVLRGKVDNDLESFKEQTDQYRRLRGGDLKAAAGFMKKAHALAPDDHEITNCLAWLLVVMPDSELRDAKQAVPLARKAVQAAPDNALYRRTLGVALCFSGECKAGLQELTRGMELSQRPTGFDHYALAIAHAKLGNKPVAGQCFDRGMAWLAANSAREPYRGELFALQSKALRARGYFSFPVPVMPSPKKKP
jgi:hypothetical protein